MMKRVYRLVACLLMLALAAGSAGGYFGPETVSEAAETVRYYIYLDENKFEVSEQDYKTIYYLREDKNALVEFLKSILGDSMPSTFKTISGVVSKPEGATPSSGNDDPVGSPDSSDTDEQSEFIIENGVLKLYRGNSSVVRVPDKVKSVGSLAFHGNSSIKAVIFPSSVKSVGRFAFYNCTSLKYIVFPKGAKMQGPNVIYGCDNLTNIVAPKKSSAYSYATEKDIPVVTSKKTCFYDNHVYILAGDSEKRPLLNNIYGVRWKSGNKKIATVSSKGKIKGKKKGNTTIKAVANGKTYTYKVTVYEKTAAKRVDQIIHTAVRNGMSKYEKIRAVHNWFIGNVKYDYYRYLLGNVPSVSHKAEGALLKKIAVCDGYAHAFRMVMNKLKIPCKFVIGKSKGTGHGWNMVKVGGKWYHIDVTFDDPIVNGSNDNTTPYYTYFMKSSSSMKKTHKWKESRYPKCASKKYE